MHNQLRGCVKINANGKNLYKFINMIHCGHICCFNQYVKNQIFYCEIYRHDLDKVQDFADDCGVKITHYEFETLSKKLIRYRRRFGLFIGGIFAAIVIWYFTGIVMVIEVQGNTTVREDVILAALNELGIRQGTCIDDLDFTYCGNELRTMVDGISWASIRRTGNRIVVDVTETVKAPQLVRKRMTCNIIAVKSAKITQTSVYDGKLMKIVGDHVNPGDMLVSGVVKDDLGQITIHHSMGEIKGIYEETVVFKEGLNKDIKKETGKTKNEKYLNLFNFKIPLFIEGNDYKEFYESQSEDTLSILGRKLPISVTYKNFRETKTENITLSDEDAEAIIMEKIYLYEQNFFKDRKLISRDIKTKKNDSEVTYTVTYTIEGEIGEQREVFTG